MSAGRLTLAGKTVLYTGAAGGLGLETTLEFLRAGMRVVAIDHDPAKIADLAARAKAETLGGLILLDADLADLSGLRRLLDAQTAETGGIDAVVNNAAVYPLKPFEAFRIEDHQAVQRINVDAAIVCVQAALAHMRKAGWGRIVNVSSITLSGGWANLAPYVQSKGALLGLTRAWAREFGPYGITSNAIAPGAFPTDAEKIHPDPRAYARFVLDHQSVKRRGETRDVANALMFFLSEESGFINGQTLNVDGGWVMQ